MHIRIHTHTPTRVYVCIVIYTSSSYIHEKNYFCACKVHVNVCLWVWLDEFFTDVIVYVAWARL